VVPVDQVVPLAENVSMDQGACLGIPGITAHRAVHVAGDVAGRTVLVQGAAGSVGLCAVQLARQAGAKVIGTVRSSSDEPTARQAGAHEVVLSDQELVPQVRRLAPDGIDHIVEVAFGANLENDMELLKTGGSIATYATDSPTPKIPFWQMVFKNIRIFFLGSDDFPKEAKMSAAARFEPRP
jgi:NADPH:quinone reductase